MSLPPIIALLLRAMLWTPLGLSIMTLWLCSIVGTLLASLFSIVYLYIGDYLAGGILIVTALSSFCLARYLTRRFWSPPESLL